MCVTCRDPVPVTLNSFVFCHDQNLQAGVLARWLCVESVSLTSACNILGCSQAQVQPAYDAARDIMHWDALRRQEKIRYGGRGSLTTDIEADEAAFLRWKTIDEQGVHTYHWFVVVGVMERGRPDTLYIEVVGITKSVGEPRVPPLHKERWHELARRLFSEDTNGALMVDGARCYISTASACPGIVEVFSVNHSEGIFARSIECVSDVSKPFDDPQRLRPAMAGTQCIDSEWKRMKDELPPTRLKGIFEEGRQRAVKYIRMAQWKRHVYREDRWEAFCAAAKESYSGVYICLCPLRLRDCLYVAVGYGSFRLV